MSRTKEYLIKSFKIYQKMKVDIDGYEIASKSFLRNTFKIIFINKVNPNDKKVLELKDLVGFLDTSKSNVGIQTLRIDNEGGSYNLDLSLRLQREEIKAYPVVFLFLDKTCVDFCFRAVAKEILFNDWRE